MRYANIYLRLVNQPNPEDLDTEQKIINEGVLNLPSASKPFGTNIRV
jgi:hypothetical protein